MGGISCLTTFIKLEGGIARVYSCWYRTLQWPAGWTHPRKGCLRSQGPWLLWPGHSNGRSHPWQTTRAVKAQSVVRAVWLQVTVSHTVRMPWAQSSQTPSTILHSHNRLIHRNPNLTRNTLRVGCIKYTQHAQLLYQLECA